MRVLPSIAAALWLAPPAASRTMGYAGQQTRAIEALPAQETADVLAGRGTGMARAAELDRHPGPMHVLESSGEPGPAAGQRAAVQRGFDRVTARAKPLGAELVRRERALDEAFARRSITPADLAGQTAAIGRVQGRLRAVPLAAHVETRAVLTPERVARYDDLRGDTGAAAPGTPEDTPGGGAGGHGGHRGMAPH